MLVKIQKTDTSVLAVWKVTESRDELLSELERTYFLERDVLSLSTESRQIERLAVRVLLKKILGKEVSIEYEKSDKPYLTDASYNISISHTKDYVAVFLDEEKHVGIDIEKISEKVKRIKSRFISDREHIDAANELVHLLLHWSAKEAMFKVLNEEGVNLKEHLQIGVFSPQKSGFFYANETRTNERKTFCVNYEVSDDYVLTWLSSEN